LEKLPISKIIIHGFERKKCNEKKNDESLCSLVSTVETCLIFIHLEEDFKSEN